MLLPKECIVRDRAYLNLVRAEPCIVTRVTGQCEPAHLRLLGSGGTAMKPSDARCLPLHHELHRRQSNEGELAVWLWCANEYPDFLARLLIEVAEARYRTWSAV